MEGDKRKEKFLQWHPAFFAGLQIELKEDADNLIFENEHQLGTKPMGIDILIIKKEADRPVRKNIGQIFRKYNILEYKAPGDYLSIDDFYKVYGYACFYKADTGKMDAIPVEELARVYKAHKNEHLYQSVMEIIMRANSKKFREASGMCEALVELMEEVMGDRMREELAIKLEEQEKEFEIRKLEQEKEFEIRKLEQKKEFEIRKLEQKKEFEIRKLEQEKELEKKYEKELERKLQRKNILILKLSEQGRVEEIIKTASDPEYEKNLLEEFGI